MTLLWPGLLLGLALSLVSLILMDQVIPWGQKKIEQIVSEAVEDIFLDMLRTKHIVADPKRGVSVMVMDVDGKTLIRPTFRYSSEGADPVMVQAQTATIRFDLEKRDIVIHLSRGQVELGRDRTFSIRDNEIRIAMPKQLADTHPRHLTIREINELMGEIRSDLNTYTAGRDFRTIFALTLGEYEDLMTDLTLYHQEYEKPKQADLRKLNTEIHSRFAMSTSCLFFVLIGGPFAMLQARRQFLTSFIICFVPILIVYYPLTLGMMNLCKTGQADPAWAMWIGNAVLLTAGLHILRKVRRH
jgi:lipopolysaccharide export system permease protein